MMNFPFRRTIVCGACLALIMLANTAVEAERNDDSERNRRPKIGLVLSGGAARGVAHIGVLKALEQLHVPVDYIAGTSMGAIVGGLYASGMSPKEIEHWFANADWQYLLSDAVPRDSESFRKKERDWRLNQNLEIGVSGTGKVQLPVGLISGQKLLVSLRELTLSVRNVEDFDRLPIPFRAIATDLATGQKVVLGSGSLADAMQASMAVPGVFTPVKINGRTLVDGGISSNLPIETVRAMGADIVIAVDVRPELESAEALTSAIAVTNQMLDILIQRETVAQIQTLQPRDVYIRLKLPGASSTDFAGSGANVTAGYEKTVAYENELRALAVSPGRFDGYLARQRIPRRNGVAISFLEFNSPSGPVHQPLDHDVLFAPGERVEIWKFRQELLGVKGFDDAQIVDFHVIEQDGKYGLQLETQPPQRGPNYLNVGFDFDYSSSGETQADFLLSLRLTELNSLGAQWETFLSVGDLTRVFSQWYQPLDMKRRFFLAADGFYSNEFFNSLDAADRRQAFRLQTADGEVDAGVHVGRFGELRFGYARGVSKVGRSLEVPPQQTGWFDRGELRAAATVDTLDRVNFPTTGVFGRVNFDYASDNLGSSDDYTRIEAEFYKPITFQKNTIVPRIVAGIAPGNDIPLYDRFPLGGFLELSGYSRHALYDQNAIVAELIYYRELAKLPAGLGGGIYVGLSAEAGNVWSNIDQIDLGDLKYGGSLFLGADTPIGPLYIGAGGSTGGVGAVYLQLSPVFRANAWPR